MTTFKDDNKKVENNKEALKDPNLDEYHCRKGREEDDAHKSKTLQNRTHSRTNHVVNPTVSDRQGQVGHMVWKAKYTSNGEGFIGE